MFNFLKKIFSANKSNTENTQVDATPLYTVENFRKALIEDDIDFIIIMLRQEQMSMLR